METKQVLNLFKRAVREVIKEELTEILREGLQSTITEMKQPNRTTNMTGHRNPPPSSKRKPTTQFSENKWSSVLNQTEPLNDSHNPIESYASLMNENYDDTLSFTSNDAASFSATRQNMKSPGAPEVMHDPETGKTFEVKPEIAQALTRDYSALMKAINAKKGN
jgi:hypothetical protein